MRGWGRWARLMLKVLPGRRPHNNGATLGFRSLQNVQWHAKLVTEHDACFFLQHPGGTIKAIERSIPEAVNHATIELEIDVPLAPGTRCR